MCKKAVNVCIQQIENEVYSESEEVDFRIISVVLYSYYIQTFDFILDALDYLDNLFKTTDEKRSQMVQNCYCSVGQILSKLLGENSLFHFEINKQITRILDQFLAVSHRELNQIDKKSLEQTAALMEWFEVAPVFNRKN
jgi:hypothetical protein